MPTDTTIVKPTAPLFDEARLGRRRHSGPLLRFTRISYATDLPQFFTWPVRPRGVRGHGGTHLALFDEVHIAHGCAAAA